MNGTHHDGLVQVVLHPLRLVFQEVNVGKHNSTDELDIKPWSGASFESQQPSDRIAIIANTLHFRYLELNSMKESFVIVAILSLKACILKKCSSLLSSQF